MGILISCFKVNPMNKVKIRKHFNLCRTNSKTSTANGEHCYSVCDESNNMTTCAYLKTSDNELLSMKNIINDHSIEDVQISEEFNKIDNPVLETVANQLILMNNFQLEFGMINRLEQMSFSIQNYRFTFDLYKENNIWCDNAIDICVERYLELEEPKQRECIMNVLLRLNWKNTSKQLHEAILKKYKRKIAPKPLMILHTTGLEDNFWTQKNVSNKPKLSSISMKELTPIKTRQVQDTGCPAEDASVTIKSIVDSVTSENVVTSTEQLRSCIQTLDCLENAITSFFKMAIFMPERIPAYVLVCSALKNVAVHCDNGTVTTSFKKRMSNRCETLLQSETCKTGAIAEDTLTFIGELFNKKLLPATILFDVVRASLGENSTDVSIKNVCHVLSVAGRELEKTNNLKKTMDKLNAQQTSSKWSGAIENLTNLRNNNWVHPCDDASDKSLSRGEEVIIVGRRDRPKRQYDSVKVDPFCGDTASVMYWQNCSCVYLDTIKTFI